jgi:hypothetical protein
MRHNARLLRAWRTFHRERLEEALDDVGRGALERLLAQLEDLRSARELVACVSAQVDDALARPAPGCIPADQSQSRVSRKAGKACRSQSRRISKVGA